MNTRATTKRPDTSGCSFREEYKPTASAGDVTATLVFMDRRVGGPGAEMKVVETVVRFRSVQMMDDFVGEQWSSEVCLHYEPVFLPIPTTSYIQGNVPVPSDNTATFPAVTFISEPALEVVSGPSSLYHDS